MDEIKTKSENHVTDNNSSGDKNKTDEIDLTKTSDNSCSQNVECVDCSTGTENANATETNNTDNKSSINEASELIHQQNPSLEKNSKNTCEGNPSENSRRISDDFIILDDDDVISESQTNVKAEPQWTSLDDGVTVKEEPQVIEIDLEAVSETTLIENEKEQTTEGVKEGNCVESASNENATESSQNEEKISNSKGKSKENSPTKEENSEKLCDSLVLTLDEKELGEISEATDTKSTSNEDQTALEKDAGAENATKKTNDKKKDEKEKKAAKINELEDTEASAATVDKKSNEKRDKRGKDSPKSHDDSRKVKENTPDNSSKSKIIWVSNLKRSTKATDLKQYINKFGKVMTTKIVTDGQKCYGYVVMENQKDVANCINNLNGSEYDDVIITLSTTKPAIYKTKVKTSDHKDSADEKKEKTDEAKDKKKSKKDGERKSRDKKSIRRKRSRSIDPLTTKFDVKKSRSRSVEDRIQREYFREKQEKERLKRKLMIEIQRSRDENQRLREIEEKQRRMEFKLEQERKRLRIEKELLEREKREMIQLEEEKRKIEKEKMNLFRQRMAIEKSLRESKRKKSPDNDMKSKKGRERDGENDYDKFDLDRRANQQKGIERYPNPRRSKERKNMNEDRRPFYGEDGDRRSGHHDKDAIPPAKSRKEDRDFGCVPPPPPKLNNDFEVPKRNKMEEGVRYYDRKMSENPPFKSEYPYRRNDFEKNKPPISRNQDGRRDDRLPHGGREPPQRMPWNSGTSEPWKVGPEPSGGGFVVNRYPDSGYAPLHYGSSRPPPPPYYNPQPVGMQPDYNKYYYNHHNSRKY